MIKNKINLEKKIIQNKFNITKNFIYFLIAPLIIILIGIILLSTIGFNLGTDFTGYSVFKVYVNNEPEITDENVNSYDLNDKDDYKEVYNKIVSAIEDQNVKITSYLVSSMDIVGENFIVSNGQAIEVKIQHDTNKIELINEQNNNIYENLVDEFSYQNYDGAISSVDFVNPSSNLTWIISIVSSIIFAFIVAAIYLSLRYNRTASLVMLMQMALDIFLVFALLTICRITINFSLGIIFLSTFIFSLFNIIYVYMKINDIFKSGKYGSLNNNELTNVATKEITYKKMLIYISLIIISIIFAIVSVEGVRQVAISLILALISTFYTSQFILPSFISTFYKAKNLKK